MIPRNISKYCIYIIILLIEVYCDEKSSLTFVIDDTSSMNDEIEQVKSGVNRIFNAVLKSKQSQIEDFVLVTFNDPDPDGFDYNYDRFRDYAGQLRTKTKDKHEFEEALSRIKVYGGGYCPEYPMSGIMTGIDKSRPRSTIYVFTDASAKDYKKYEAVKNLAIQKQSTVTFVLTGACGFTERSPGYKVYQDLSDATSGTVFNIPKGGVNTIITDIVTSIESRRSVLINKMVHGIDQCHLDFNIDYKYKDPIVTVTGRNPTLAVIGPDGRNAKTKIQALTGKVLIVMIVDSKPGVYNATVGCVYETHVKVAAKTEIIFQHGFSTSIVSFQDAATRPLPGVQSHIYIKVTDGSIVLQSVKIIDSKSDTKLYNSLLSVFNDKDDVYITEPVQFPEKSLFQLEITGYDPSTNETITRRGPPIEVQPPPPVVIKHKAPEVTIIEGPKVDVDYNGAISLTCKVSAYPTPEITWTSATGAILNSKSNEVELYEYSSYLQLSNVTNSGSYYCKASNDVARNKEAKVDVNIWFQVKSGPSETTLVKYGEEKKLLCNIISSYPMDIQWKTHLSPSEYSLSADKKELTIKSVNIEAQGKYTCEMILRSNPVKTHSISTRVVITDLEAPKITYSDQTITVLNGQRMTATCKANGTPKPIVTWQFKSGNSDVFVKISNSGEQLTYSTISYKQAGSYKCNAVNKVGSDSRVIEVVVNEAPKITISDKNVTVMIGQRMTTVCRANGIPKPTVTWQFKSKYSDVFENIPDIGEQLTKYSITYEWSGSYKCIAKNKVGEQSGTIEVFVHGEPNITNVDTVYRGVTGDWVLKIPCEVTGVPEPTITWKHKNEVVISDGKITVSTNALLIKNPTEKDSSEFTCEARNEYGYANKSFEALISDFVVKDDGIEYLSNYYYVEHGKSEDIKCLLKAENHDPQSVRWYVNGKITDVVGLIYPLKDAGFSNDGNYTCRLNTNQGSESLNYIVDVGFKPRFLSSASLTINWNSDEEAELDCSVKAKPAETVKWLYNGKELDGKEAELFTSDWGTFTCNVSNPHGSVQRTFNVLHDGCLIDTTVDKMQNTPLLVDEKISAWPRFLPNIYNEFLTISRKAIIILECSTLDQTTNTFITHPTAGRIEAECLKEDKFIVDGTEYKFKDLQCKKNVNFSQVFSKKSCMKNGQIIETGFNLRDGFFGVYDVCYSNLDHRTEYVKMQMSEDNIKMGKLNDEMIKCQFNSRWLVNPEDVAFGPAQVATMSDKYNAVPVYEPCGNSSRMSWTDVERVVQLFDHTTMIVWTGASHYNPHGIPRYLWKVAKLEEDIYQTFVYVNAPNPDSSDIKCTKAVLKTVSDTRIKDKDPYTYSCSMEDFLKAFSVPLSEFGLSL